MILSHGVSAAHWTMLESEVNMYFDSLATNKLNIEETWIYHGF